MSTMTVGTCDDCPLLAGAAKFPCPVHGRMITASQARLCRERPGYYDLWQADKARQQPKRMGLGDMVEAGLKKVGITKERVSRILRRPCGCAARKEWLNRMGRKLGIG